MKVFKKFQFTKEEVEALQTVREMLQDIEEDDYNMLLREIQCNSCSGDLYADIYYLSKLAERNVEENP